MQRNFRRKITIISSLAIIGFIPSFPAFGQSAAPDVGKIVGSAACPKLNAHSNKACRFTRNKHGFQVWPSRMVVETTLDPNVWLVKSAGHKDGMFDHTLRFRKDDHVTFQCFVGRGRYWGPTGFTITRGGVWATIGEPVVTVASIGAGAVAAYFAPPAAPAATMAGGMAAEELGNALSGLGSKAWERSAAAIATDICRTLSAGT